MAAQTKPCDVKILLANSEPSTHGCTDQALRREDSPCQLGAVHTWHFCDIRWGQDDFCLRQLSGRPLPGCVDQEKPKVPSHNPRGRILNLPGQPGPGFDGIAAGTLGKALRCVAYLLAIPDPLDQRR